MVRPSARSRRAKRDRAGSERLRDLEAGRSRRPAMAARLVAELTALLQQQANSARTQKSSIQTAAASRAPAAAELGPGVEAKLVRDIGDVGLNGALGQEQPGTIHMPPGRTLSRTCAGPGAASRRFPASTFEF